MEALYRACNTAFSRFFCPKTELFYEFIPDGEPSARSHLPSAADIQKKYPEPLRMGNGDGGFDAERRQCAGRGALPCGYVTCLKTGREKTTAEQKPKKESTPLTKREKSVII